MRSWTMSNHVANCVTEIRRGKIAPLIIKSVKEIAFFGGTSLNLIYACLHEFDDLILEMKNVLQEASTLLQQERVERTD